MTRNFLRCMIHWMTGTEIVKIKSQFIEVYPHIHLWCNVIFGPVDSLGTWIWLPMYWIGDSSSPNIWYILSFSYEDAAYRYYRTQCEESSAQRRGKCPENRQRKRRHEHLCQVSADIEPFTTINRGNQLAIHTYGWYAVEVSGQCSLYILSSESA